MAHVALFVTPSLDCSWVGDQQHVLSLLVPLSHKPFTFPCFRFLQARFMVQGGVKVSRNEINEQRIPLKQELKTGAKLYVCVCCICICMPTNMYLCIYIYIYYMYTA